MDQHFLTASSDSLPLDAATRELRHLIRARQQQQVRQRERFEFGRNWRSFLDSVDERRIDEAGQSLRAMLHREDLRGLTFLDAGAGSGLFSLAAARLGARRVLSFDYDPQCVECADLLRARYGSGLGEWTVELGDVLAAEYMRQLGRFDVVYSWGVLHQTGDMWRALEHVAEATAPGGLLYLSIYNHQPWLTPCWTLVKRLYNRGPRALRPLLASGYLAARWPLRWLSAAKGGSNAPERPPRSPRGMSAWHDAVDWVGGYPFETAAPEAVFRFFRDRRFQLQELTTVGGGSGCNEFVLLRAGERDAHSARD